MGRTPIQNVSECPSEHLLKGSIHNCQCLAHLVELTHSDYCNSVGRLKPGTRFKTHLLECLVAGCLCAPGGPGVMRRQTDRARPGIDKGPPQFTITTLAIIANNLFY